MGMWYTVWPRFSLSRSLFLSFFLYLVVKKRVCPGAMGMGLPLSLSLRKKGAQGAVGIGFGVGALAFPPSFSRSFSIYHLSPPLRKKEIVNELG